MPKKLCIKTYGCQMNVYDSARMADVLAPLGYERADDPHAADVVILNTCHIREKAAEKIYSELGRLKPIKEHARADGSRPVLAVAGCVAQAEGEEILRRAPHVDLVFGPQTYHRLPAMLARLAGTAHAVVDTAFSPEPKFDSLPAGGANRTSVTAFLTIQEGCDKFCSFCVVPYTRGAEYSRPAADVLAEARRLAAAGVREITLLGQNVNAYHGAAPGAGTWDLADLVAAVAEVPGIERIRYTTSHPLDMSDDLIAAHRDVPALMPYLHLPIQSGSDRVLAAMRRRHRVADYLRIVGRLRAARPDIALSSDFIVGFPGETDHDFRATLDLVGKVGFAQAFSFKYSARPGTPAAAARQIDAAVKDERLAALQQLLDGQQRAFNAGCAGRVLPVLFEGRGRRPGQLTGRSPYLQAVHADGPENRIGEIVPVRINRALANSLAGDVAEGAPA